MGYEVGGREDGMWVKSMESDSATLRISSRLDSRGLDSQEGRWLARESVELFCDEGVDEEGSAKMECEAELVAFL